MHWMKFEKNAWTFLNSCYVHIIFSVQWSTAQHAKLFVPPQVEVEKKKKKRTQTTAMKINVDSNLRNICSNQFWSPLNSEVSWLLNKNMFSLYSDLDQEACSDNSIHTRHTSFCRKARVLCLRHASLNNRLAKLCYVFRRVIAS